MLLPGGSLHGVRQLCSAHLSHSTAMLQGYAMRMITSRAIGPNIAADGWTTLPKDVLWPVSDLVSHLSLTHVTFSSKFRGWQYKALTSSLVIQIPFCRFICIATIAMYKLCTNWRRVKIHSSASSIPHFCV